MLKIIGLVFLVSCRENETFMEYNGYNDIIVDSPALLLNLLKKDLQKKYGLYLIEDNGTIESWYLEKNEHTQIVFNINKIENNTIYGSYLNPPLRDLDMKKQVQNQ